MENARETWRRLMRLWRRAEQESGLDEEIRFHIEKQIEKNIARGMGPEEARRDALVRFGGVERAKEWVRDEVRPAWLEDFARDVRFAVRALRNAPGFAAVSILTLGVGLGAATAVFSVVNGVLLRPLPYPESHRIVRVLQVDSAGRPANNVSGPNFEDWRQQSRSFEALALLSGGGPVSVVADGQADRADVLWVSEQFLDVLGVRPVVGRPFSAEERRPGGPPAALVSYGYWQRWLGGAADLTGKSLRVEGRSHPVIGVLPPEFDYPAGTDVVLPFAHDPSTENRTAHNYRAIGRLAPGVGLEQARSELSAISRAVKARYGSETWMWDATAIPLQEVVTGGVRSTLLILFGAAALLLLIACANVSNLLLARAASRERELAVRLALGAGRGRLVRQFVAESVVLCAASGALGVLIAYGGVAALLALEPGDLPRVREVAVSWAALAFAFAAALACALALAFATTMRAAAREIRGALTDAQRTLAGGGRSQRVRSGLVVAQIALTLILLAGAGLLARSFSRLLAVDPGYRTSDALVLDIALPSVWESEDREAAGRQQAAFREELVARLRALPRVREVGIINSLPLGADGYADGMFIEMTRPDEIQSLEDFERLGPTGRERAGHAGFRVASAGYFRAMGIPLVRGRLFEEGDAYDAPHVAVISESLARARWPDADPIGRYIQFGNMDGDLRAFRIVGIVGDVREASLESRPEPLFYAEHRQRPRQASSFSVVVYGTEDASVAGAAQRIVRDLAPDVPVRVRRLAGMFDDALAGRRFSLLLLGVFAATALVLATMGIYGVVSYLVAQRTREIGIRMALGAGHRDVLRLVIGRGAMLVAAGALLGLVAALALTRLLSGMLYGISATDPVAFAAVVFLVAAAALLASYVPARQAARL
ncbi:MAG TPA: ABC transporter permease, partial [Longimicrobiales bacterium]